MAGFRTILCEEMSLEFGDAFINIHPSLLPAFPGDMAVADALTFGVKVTGTTIHVATKKFDDGRIIAQIPVPVFTQDTPESLHRRIKRVEGVLYPFWIRKLTRKKRVVKKSHHKKKP